MNRSPTIEEVKELPFYKAYVETQKKVLAEILGWSGSETLTHIEEMLKVEGCRAWFGHDSPCKDVSYVIINGLFSRGDRPGGLPGVKLAQKIRRILEGSGRTFNMFPDTDQDFDWKSAKQEILALVKEFKARSVNSK